MGASRQLNSTDRFLPLLSEKFPTILSADAEIINLKAILGLPKGTEYFFSDLHGEHESFIHMLKSASGVIRAKIDMLFEKSLTVSQRASLATLIYRPEKELKKAKETEADFDDFCRITIYQLLEVCQAVSSKYTRSKSRKRMPKEFAYIIDELMHGGEKSNHCGYYSHCIDAIIKTGCAESFIVGLCTSIDRLSIDILHIIGDIFDRGPHADLIFDELMKQYFVDIQWGNHDISWMGAAAGNTACIANVIRLGISYNNFDLLEDGYGINLRPLSIFALRTYSDDPCHLFLPHLLDRNKYDDIDPTLASKMHKAIAVIQFKLEGQLILRHPEYGMQDRTMLDRIQYKNGTILLDGKTYPLKDTLFPTIDPRSPFTLTEGEAALLKTLAASFRHSERLQKHISFLYDHGSMYKCFNGNLLYHGCIPMCDDGSFACFHIGNHDYSGKALLDKLDSMARLAYFGDDSPDKEEALDFLWYLSCGKLSPLYGKDKMSTFERIFIEDKTVSKETMNPYFHLIESPEICQKILKEFHMTGAHSHIINGHVPVRMKDGESPVKGNGLLFVIDGGMSKAYHAQTGIGGYTLIFNSHHLALAEHKPYRFLHGELQNTDEESSPVVRIVDVMPVRIKVANTDIGKELNRQISDLEALVSAYRSGQLHQRLG